MGNVQSLWLVPRDPKRSATILFSIDHEMQYSGDLFPRNLTTAGSFSQLALRERKEKKQKVKLAQVKNKLRRPMK